MGIQGRPRRVVSDSLPEHAAMGVMLITTDTKEVYMGLGANKPLKKMDNEADTEYVETFADLPIQGKKNINYMVLNDETDHGKISMYLFDEGTNTYKKVDEYHDAIKVGQKEMDGVVEFVAGTNVTLDVEDNKIIFSATGGGSTNASDINVEDVDNLFTASKLEDVLKELFTYASSGKSEVAEAIGLETGDTYTAIIAELEQIKTTLVSQLDAKGIVASTNEKFIDLVNKVSQIDGEASRSVERTVKLNITAPYELRVPISSSVKQEDILALLYEFIPSESGIVHYDVEFDNSDETDFEVNNNIVFDGTMRLRDEHDLLLQTDETWTDEGIIQFVDIDTTDFVETNGVIIE